MVEAKSFSDEVMVDCPRSVYAFLAVLGVSKLAEGGLWDMRASPWHEYPGRLEAVSRVAGWLLQNDNRGDEAVWGRKWTVPPVFEEVLAYYVLRQQEEDAQSGIVYESHENRLGGLCKLAEEKMDGLIGEMLACMPGASMEVVTDYIKDFVLGDAVVTTLLLNGGKWKSVPIEVRKGIERLGMSEDKYNSWSFGQDGVLNYRDVENWLFARVLAAVWFEGDEEKIKKNLPLVWTVSQVYQLFSDLKHEKNKHELTYKLWHKETDATRVEFALSEIRSLIGRKELSGVDRVLAILAVPMVWGLCRLSSKGEWEN